MAKFKQDTYPLRFHKAYSNSFDAIVEGTEKLSKHYSKFKKDDLLDRIMVADNNHVVTITNPNRQEIEEYIERNKLDKKPENYLRVSYFDANGSSNHEFVIKYGDVLQSLERQGYVDGCEADLDRLQDFYSFQRNVECMPYKMAHNNGSIDYREYLTQIEPICKRYAPLVEKQEHEMKMEEFNCIRKMFGLSDKMEFCCYKNLSVIEPYGNQFSVTEYCEDGTKKQHKDLYNSEFDAWS